MIFGRYDFNAYFTPLGPNLQWCNSQKTERRYSIPPLLLDHQSDRIFVNISFQIPSDWRDIFTIQLCIKLHRIGNLIPAGQISNTIECLSFLIWTLKSKTEYNHYFNFLKSGIWNRGNRDRLRKQDWRREKNIFFFPREEISLETNNNLTITITSGIKHQLIRMGYECRTRAGWFLSFPWP